MVKTDEKLGIIYTRDSGGAISPRVFEIFKLAHAA
jgi:hypothetical protein